MTTPSSYIPPKIWQQTISGGAFANINRSVSGSTHKKTLPLGKHPMQLYSQGTPNGVKVTVMMEELLSLGYAGAEYDAWLIRIAEGEQFSNDFVKINPNSKIPALLDCGGKTPLRVFESGAILLYLAEKFGALLPRDIATRTEALNWLFWQIGSAPFVGGGFGHFYVYAPEKFEYPINRYAMETKRQLDVLNCHLAENRYLAGEEYSIADIAAWPWYGWLVQGVLYDAGDFLSVQEYPNVKRWADEISARSAVIRGRKVNRTGDDGIAERHQASDLD
ncbi:MAG: glutathione-dependent disulfide-bond oxidoreductase [Sodalis sp. (in: enterobacteria)]